MVISRLAQHVERDCVTPTPLTAAQYIVASMCGNAQQPRPKLRAMKARDVSVRCEKDLLSDIGRRVSVTYSIAQID